MALPSKKYMRKAQKKGRRGDTLLAHINPEEAALLKSLGGAGTRNPETGLLEFYADSDPAGTDPGSGMGGGDPLGHDAADSGAGSPSDQDREGLAGGPGAPQSGAQPATAGDLGYDPGRGFATFSVDDPGNPSFSNSLSLSQEQDLVGKVLGVNPIGIVMKAGEKAADFAESLGMTVDRSSKAYGVAERDQGRTGGGFTEAGAPTQAAPSGSLSPLDMLLATASYPQRNLIPFGGDPYTYGFGGEHQFFKPNPGYAGGGMVTGPGGGTDDAIPAVVDGVGPARISSGEVVIPAMAVAAMGDGSSEEGARKWMGLAKLIMKTKFGKSELPKASGGLQTLLNSVR